MNWLLIAAILPGLHWTGDIDTAARLKPAGVERVVVPPASVAAWKQAGLAAESDAELSGYTEVEAPSMRRERSVAAATTIPWVEANGWHFLRGVKTVYYKDVPRGRAALAAAEAFSYGVDAVLDVNAEDLDEFGQMVRFLAKINRGEEQIVADIGFVDDDSFESQEGMKLLERRNLLFRTVERPDPALDLNVEIGSDQFPRDEAADPSQFARSVRQKLTDARRKLRIYGSEVVLGHVTSADGVTRVHLLNHARRGSTLGLRVRVEGEFTTARLASFGTDDTAVEDLRVRDGGTEFTVPRLDVYAVIDLE